MNPENDIFEIFNQILAKKSKISVNSTEEMEIEGRIPSKPFIFWIGSLKAKEGRNLWWFSDLDPEQEEWETESK